MRRIPFSVIRRRPLPCSGEVALLPVLSLLTLMSRRGLVVPELSIRGSSWAEAATSQTTAPKIGTLTETWLALVFPLKRKG